MQLFPEVVLHTTKSAQIRECSTKFVGSFYFLRVHTTKPQIFSLASNCWLQTWRGAVFT